MNLPEPLYQCPRCQRTGFTERGLRRHYCDSGARLTGRPLPPTDQFAPHAGRTRLTEGELASAIATPQPRKPTRIPC